MGGTREVLWADRGQDARVEILPACCCPCRSSRLVDGRRSRRAGSVRSWGRCAQVWRSMLSFVELVEMSVGRSGSTPNIPRPLGGPDANCRRPQVLGTRRASGVEGLVSSTCRRA